MKKKILLIGIIMLFMVMLTNKSHAAIEIKPSPEANANNVLVNTTVSNSYLLCQKMTEKGESLYGATVVPHLSTNKDWGAVSYLSNSIYGTNSKGENTGTKINIDGVDYYSTNGNVTGVINWGVNCYNSSLWTQTSSLIQAYIDDNSESTAKDNVKELENAARNGSRFVEIIDTSDSTLQNTQGMGMGETRLYPWKQWNVVHSNVNNPVTIREGLFGYNASVYYNSNTTSGIASSRATFRPVIWNK